MASLLVKLLNCIGLKVANLMISTRAFFALRIVDLHKANDTSI